MKFGYPPSYHPLDHLAPYMITIFKTIQLYEVITSESINCKTKFTATKQNHIARHEESMGHELFLPHSQRKHHTHASSAGFQTQNVQPQRCENPQWNRASLQTLSCLGSGNCSISKNAKCSSFKHFVLGVLASAKASSKHILYSLFRGKPAGVSWRRSASGCMEQPPPRAAGEDRGLL